MNNEDERTGPPSVITHEEMEAFQKAEDDRAEAERNALTRNAGRLALARRLSRSLGSLAPLRLP